MSGPGRARFPQPSYATHGARRPARRSRMRLRTPQGPPTGDGIFPRRAPAAGDVVRTLRLRPYRAFGPCTEAASGTEHSRHAFRSPPTPRCRARIVGASGAPRRTPRQRRRTTGERTARSSSLGTLGSSRRAAGRPSAIEASNWLLLLPTRSLRPRAHRRHIEPTRLSKLLDLHLRSPDTAEGPKRPTTDRRTWFPAHRVRVPPRHEIAHARAGVACTTPPPRPSAGRTRSADAKLRPAVPGLGETALGDRWRRCSRSLLSQPRPAARRIVVGVTTPPLGYRRPLPRRPTAAGRCRLQGIRSALDTSPSRAAASSPRHGMDPGADPRSRAASDRPGRPSPGYDSHRGCRAIPLRTERMPPARRVVAGAVTRPPAVAGRLPRRAEHHRPFPLGSPPIAAAAVVWGSGRSARAPSRRPSARARETRDPRRRGCAAPVPRRHPPRGRLVTRSVRTGSRACSRVTGPPTANPVVSSTSSWSEVRGRDLAWAARRTKTSAPGASSLQSECEPGGFAAERAHRSEEPLRADRSVGPLRSGQLHLFGRPDRRPTRGKRFREHRSRGLTGIGRSRPPDSRLESSSAPYFAERPRADSLDASPEPLAGSSRPARTSKEMQPDFWLPGLRLAVPRRSRRWRATRSPSRPSRLAKARPRLRPRKNVGPFGSALPCREADPRAQRNGDPARCRCGLCGRVPPSLPGGPGGGSAPARRVPAVAETEKNGPGRSRPPGAEGPPPRRADRPSTGDHNSAVGVRPTARGARPCRVARRSPTPPTVW